MADRWRRPGLVGLVGLVGSLVLAVPVPAWADSTRDGQWHLSYLAAAQVHAVSRGAGVMVAVVDSGVDGNHPDLRGNVLPGRDLIDPARPDAWRDTDGHGTAMAALIAAHGHGVAGDDGVLGVAPAARVLPVRVPEAIGDSRQVSEAIRYAVDHGADVVNLSLGNDIDAPDIVAAVEYALAHDVVVVGGAGNTAHGSKRVISPARIPGVVAVSGINKDGSFAREAVQGPEVVLAAPAVAIASATPGGGYWTATGTSNATAIVSGTAALIRARFPELNAASVIERLIRTADDKGPRGRDPRYGYGVVDPLAALTEDVARVDRNPLISHSAEPARRSGAGAGAADGTPVGPLVAVGVGLLAALVSLAGFVGALGRRRGSPQPSVPP